MNKVRVQQVYLLLLFSLACAPSGPALRAPGPPEGFLAAEWRRASALSPQPPLPPSPTNALADDPRAALLGQRLFFDPELSGALVRTSDLGTAGETGRVACDACHAPEGWFVDRRAPGRGHGSLGADVLSHRNSPTLVNAAYYEWQQWDGVFDSLWNHSTTTPEHPSIMHGSRVRIARVLARKYAAPYERLFGAWPALDLTRVPEDASPPTSVWFAVSGDKSQIPAWNALTPEQQQGFDEVYANYGKLLEAYLRRLVSGPSPFDRYIAGERDALSASAARGLRLFVGKAACHECHSGPMLSDAAWNGRAWEPGKGFHNLGLAQDPDAVPTIADRDIGRGPLLRALLADSPNPLNVFSGVSRFSDDPAYGRAKLERAAAVDPDAQLGAFRTPSLRNVAQTAPYMHNGYLATLDDVVRFYDQGGHASGFVGEKDKLVFELDLTEQERADLVAFLKSLTGEPVPRELRQAPGR